ncbi:3-oxoacyl-ACP synthase III [Pelagicoccus sp. SDUM812003]|uniref:3-oxoacyl-ACP synthase III n=1 Tax=Pelagicoccus sp. SDUM812003 TaxID=3041267 RepID=UPI00280CEA90|nr:3-oxoacyl-ACP synthase III [Pelagicoccus sp. SDUM812003]MDQ8203177.1 3-oxoacyl-ACP synthase III [Pelagicoccus sp. SDUM812003]
MKIRSSVIDSLAYVSPPTAWSSADIESKLAPLYQRLRLPEGRLELMTGIKERRFWDNPVRPSEIAAQAGRKALAQSTISAEQIEVCIHSSVCRDMLEPATASFAHRLMGLPEGVQVFDVSNACLGFLNSISLLSAMIDAGQIKAGIVVSGENGKPLLERTIQQLLGGEHTRKSIKPFFANLTIGAGAVAAIVCHESLSPGGHRVLGGSVLADTSSNDLCKGDASLGGDGLEMQTDSEEMLHAGVSLAKRTWAAFKKELDWSEATPDRVITHQVGAAHQRLLFESLGLQMEKDYSSYQTFGNTGSAALPITLAKAAEDGAVKAGDKLALLGIGSGLNCLMMGVEW